MSETPFRVDTTTAGNPCVRNAKGDVLHVCVTDDAARKALGESLRVWHYAGGPALARQRDELLALLREIEPALKAHAQSYAHACCTTELHPFDAALLDRLAAAIKEKP